MRQLVYDIPTRLFHWIFLGLFLTAFIIAKTIDDESPIYSYHMIAGIILNFIVWLRVIWGLIGSKHARFSGFALNPIDLLNYFKGILTGDKKKWAGHNPASSWSALAFLIFALGLGVTGYLMTTGSNKEDFEDIHEILANGFIIMAILHILGIIIHTLRHREMIALSMLDGKKENIQNDDVIKSSHAVVGITFLALFALFGGYVMQSYNSSTQTLKLLGATLQLGENEDHEHKAKGEKSNHTENGNHDQNQSEEHDD